MSYQIFTEKEINSSIYKKAPLEEIKIGKHDIGKLIVDGYFFGKVKIPNPHRNEFNESKAKNLASQLQLGKEEYNEFIKCTLKKKKYIEILKSKIE